MKSRLPGVVEPIKTSLYSLGSDQKKHIICNDTTGPRTQGKKDFGRPVLQPITTASRTVARTFLQKQTADESDSLVAAMLKALSLAKGKTTLFLISDADWTDANEQIQQITSQNRSKVTIHTVLIGRPSQPAVTSMALLAKNNQGHFSYKPIQPRIKQPVAVVTPPKAPIPIPIPSKAWTSGQPKKGTEVVVAKPAMNVTPERPAKPISAKVKRQLRGLEFALKQVAQQTQDISEGTRAKRDALAAAYNKIIAATKTMERGRYTPEADSVRTWLTDLHNAGNRLCTLSKKYSNPSTYSGCTNHHSCRKYYCYSSYRTCSSTCGSYSQYSLRGKSDANLYAEFSKELSRQRKFVCGLKPAKASGRTRRTSLPRVH
jgi:hypothetical protein